MADRTPVVIGDPRLGGLQPGDQLTMVGSVSLTHVATGSDDHAMELIVDAAGFSDVKALEINYTTGAISATDDEEVILISIDESASTGGRVVGLEVLSTAAGSSEVDAIEVGVGVHPILQISGFFEDADTVLVLAVDQTTALSGGGAGNISVFVLDDDTITIGFATAYEELEFLIDTPASGPGVAPVFEYSTGIGTWATFGPSDGTNGFRNTGVVAWVLADIPSWSTGTGTEFLIRITRTQNAISTTPILDLVQVAIGTNYHWNKDGHLIISGVDSSFGITDTADITKVATFDVSGITTATTRVFTLPDADKTIDGVGDARPSLNTEFALPIQAPHLVESNTAGLFESEVALDVNELVVRSGALTDGSGGSFTFELFHGPTLASLTSIGSVTITQGGERGVNTLGGPVTTVADDIFVVDTTAIGSFPVGTHARRQRFYFHVRSTPG